MTNIIDYSYAQIPAQAIKDAGYVAAMRYLGGSASLTPIERDNLHAAGLGIGLVFETAASEADHPERGRQDALGAEEQADSLAYPPDCPIFYADDQNDPDVSQERLYFAGVWLVARRPVGVYSGGNVVKAVMDAGYAAYGWMVETWYPHEGAEPHLVQLANTKRPYIQGVSPDSYDSNVLLRDFPLWGVDLNGGNGGATQRKDDNRMWLAFIADINYCDVYYNGVLVDGFTNNDNPNQFNVGAQMQRYLNMGVPWTFFKTENAYAGARSRLAAAAKG